MQAIQNSQVDHQSDIGFSRINYQELVDFGHPFYEVSRINVNEYINNDSELRRRMEDVSVKDGLPLVIEGFHLHEKWNDQYFTLSWLHENCGTQEITCRDLEKATDVKLSVRDYLLYIDHRAKKCVKPKIDTEAATNVGVLTPPKETPPPPDQATFDLGPFDTEDLLYAKDISCPPVWKSYLAETLLPSWLVYGKDNDLFANMDDMAAENLMVYIGVAGTWTAAHIDQCGAIGHNVMTWADEGSSSIWFMVSAKDKNEAEALFSQLGHPLEHESYFALVDELKKATFPIYLVNQKMGDFVMVPSEGYHQVVNVGNSTIKVSWNRLTPNCVNAAMRRVIKRYKEINRQEAYMIKLVITRSLEKWKDLLERNASEAELPLPIDQFTDAYRSLMLLHDMILREDWVDIIALERNLDGTEIALFQKPKQTQFENVSCDYCSVDVWNRHFHCTTCGDGDMAEYDMCASCYSKGRSCPHPQHMKFLEMTPMRTLLTARRDIIAAWNKSKLLQCQANWSEVNDTWGDSVPAEPDQPLSDMTLAYARYLANDSKTEQRCHRCWKRHSSQLKINCRNPGMTHKPAAFCEKCLYERYNVSFNDIAANVTWSCPICQGTCRCHECSEAHPGPRTEPKVKRPRKLWFREPDDDPRNRHGVADGYTIVSELKPIKYRKRTEDDSESGAEYDSDDGDNSRLVKRRKGATFQFEKSNGSLACHSGKGSVSCHLMATMNPELVNVGRFMAKYNLTKSLASFRKTEQQGVYYQELFQADSFLALAGKEYQSARNVMRRETIKRAMEARRSVETRLARVNADADPVRSIAHQSSRNNGKEKLDNAAAVAPFIEKRSTNSQSRRGIYHSDEESDEFQPTNSQATKRRQPARKLKEVASDNEDKKLEQDEDKEMNDAIYSSDEEVVGDEATGTMETNDHDVVKTTTENDQEQLQEGSLDGEKDRGEEDERMAVDEEVDEEMETGMVMSKAEFEHLREDVDMDAHQNGVETESHHSSPSGSSLSSNDDANLDEDKEIRAVQVAFEENGTVDSIAEVPDSDSESDFHQLSELKRGAQARKEGDQAHAHRKLKVVRKQEDQNNVGKK